MAHEPILHTLVLDVSDLEEGGTRHFSVEREGERLGGLVLRHEGRLHAYVNRCPHVTYSLDLAGGDVKDETGEFLMCHVHGAMFLPESGECFIGPVVGRRLERLEVELEGDTLRVHVRAAPASWPREYQGSAWEVQSVGPPEDSEEPT